MKAPLQTKAFQTKVQVGWVPAPRCVSEWATPPVTCATVKDSRLHGTPVSPIWKAVTRKFEQFSTQYGTAELPMNLALGRVQENPFSEKDIPNLKEDVIDELERAGLELKREENDRRDVPIDFRYLDFLLKAAEDPEVGLGQFSQGVRVGPSVRMPRLPALYKPKRKWRLAAQTDPSNYLEEEASWPESCWRSNYPSLSEHTERVKKVLEDQTSRGQLIKLSEDEAKARYPNLVIASLGANRKDKPNEEISARVLFDGTNGLQVNTRTRLRDQERSPIAADLTRDMREKATLGVRTFALTADVKEPTGRCRSTLGIGTSRQELTSTSIQSVLLV